MKVTPFRARWIGRIGVVLLRMLGCTWRIRVHGFDPEGQAPVIYAFLHGDMLVPAVRFRGSGAAILTSMHGDGELIAQVIHRLGFVTVRGSSTRGGARAFLQLVNQCSQRHWAVTPDGPRGPRGVVHEGVIQLASVSGRAIIPAGHAVRWGKQLKSWDRFVIPAPFTRVQVTHGEPLQVPPDIDREQRSRLATELERRLQMAEFQAAELLAGRQ